MSLFRRLVAPLTVVAAFAVAAPAAQAQFTDSTTFNTGTITVAVDDDGPAFDSVALTVTATSPTALQNTVLFLGDSIPNYAVSADGLYDSPYVEPGGPDCAVYDTLNPRSTPVTVAGNGLSFSVDLPKGEVIYRDTVRFAPGVIGTDNDCDADGYPGLEIDYNNDADEFAGFTWANPEAPVVEITGGRRQVALSFDQAPGTQYDIYRVIDGVTQSSPVDEIHGGNGDDVHVVIDHFSVDEYLSPGTTYGFKVQATRLFLDNNGDYLPSPLSALASATTDAAQTIQISGAPAASTTARSAQFTWSINSNEAPYCYLDPPPDLQHSPDETPCSATGATLDGLALGPHSFTVNTPDGESHYTHTWTVVAPPVPPVVVPPTTPVNPKDLDGDGIDNTWLVGGVPARAPGVAKARIVGGNVKLTLAKAPKGAKKIRVYRADGKGGYKLVKTITPKSKSFTDTKTKAGHTYKYKTVAVNSKGQQGAASKAATIKVKKKK